MYESKQQQRDGEATASRRQEMLLEFLRDQDAACPVCGYNVRSLTRPICPECKQELVLTVGALQLRLGWLLAAVAPGFFSGIAACFVCIPTLAIYFEDDLFLLPLVGGVLFGWCSGLFAIILAAKRNRFLAQTRTRQRWFALIIWMVHITAFVLLVISLGPQI